MQLSDELRRDLEEVLQPARRQARIVGHPTTTLEDLFLRIVEESKAHPGRRYLPAAGRPGGRQTADGETATRAKERNPAGS